MDNNAYRNFTIFHKRLADRVVTYEEQNLGFLLIHLDDGTAILYDDYYQRIRDVPKEPNSMSEAEYRKEFGYRLIRLMDIRNITQDELAKRTGIQRCQINKYINGKTTPSFYNVDKIAKALKCSVDDLRYIN